MTDSRLAGVILAGGESKRFGSDKAWALLEGRTLFDWVSRAVASACAPVYVVVPEGRVLPHVEALYTRLDDEFPGEGPLGGMLTAFRAIRRGAAFVTACDMPLLERAVVEELARRRGDVAAAAVETDGTAQPLCAVYDVAACLPEAEALFARGERSVQALLRSVRVERVAIEGSVAARLKSVNTREDLAAIAREFGEVGGTGAEGRG